MMLMDKKKFMASAVIVLIGFIITNLSAQEEHLFIDNRSFYAAKQRSGVNFPHQKHMIAVDDCMKCHHRYENGRNTLDTDDLAANNHAIRCPSCHGFSGNSKYNLTEAYHLQCIGCHEKMEKSAGPRLCAGCHPRRGATK